MPRFTVRESFLAAAIFVVLVTWFVDRQVLHQAVQTASAIIASARKKLPPITPPRHHCWGFFMRSPLAPMRLPAQRYAKSIRMSIVVAALSVGFWEARAQTNCRGVFMR